MHDKWVNPTCIGISALATATQTDDLLRYIQLGLTILMIIISTSFTLWKWYKEAKKDGHISKEEIKDGIDIIQDGLGNSKNTINDNKEDKK